MPAHKEYQDKNYNKLIDEAFDLIAEDGLATHKALKQVGVSFSKFYEMIESDEVRAKRYARACEVRAEILEAEMIDIADDSKGDTKVINRGGEDVEVVDNEVIQRSKLKVETRKWLIGKLKPKKYGDKTTTELTGADGKDLIPTVVFKLDDRAKQTFANDERGVE
jgi:hypothetical protein